MPNNGPVRHERAIQKPRKLQMKLPPMLKNEWDYFFWLSAQKTLTPTQASHLAFLEERIK